MSLCRPFKEDRLALSLSTTLLQAIDSMMGWLNLALCLQVVSQAPQHFRSSETQATSQSSPTPTPPLLHCPSALSPPPIPTPMCRQVVCQAPQHFRFPRRKPFVNQASTPPPVPSLSICSVTTSHPNPQPHHLLLYQCSLPWSPLCDYPSASSTENFIGNSMQPVSPPPPPRIQSSIQTSCINSLLSENRFWQPETLASALGNEDVGACGLHVHQRHKVHGHV